MRMASYITLGVSAALFVLFLALWFIGLVAGQTFGGFLHLLLIASVLPALGFVIGLILLIISLAKK